MHVDEPEEPYKPEMQLEYAGGGPGARGRTALGMDDSGPPLDRRRLPTPPWYAFPFGKWRLKGFRKLFGGFPLKTAMFVLKQHEVPPLYRLGVGLRWGFIDPERDNFSLEDFDVLLAVDPNNDYLNGYKLKEELDKIELAVAYQLSLKYGWNYCKYMEEQNSDRFELEWGVAPRD